MGSGKTSVGRRLSCVLNRDFFDSDFEIISKTGVSIEHIFDIEGEKGFRERETKMLMELMKIQNIVIATGGGIVTIPKNLEILQDSFVVYLKADIRTLVERCSYSKSRPLINQAEDKEQVIRDIVEKRQALYEQVADITVNTAGKKLYAIIKAIKEGITTIS